MTPKPRATLSLLAALALILAACDDEQAQTPDLGIDAQVTADGSTPDAPAPDQAAPDLSAPDLLVPDQLVPDQLVPDLPPPTCTDGKQNGDETDVDCGGATCPKCAVKQTCKVLTDCKSGVCTAGVCAAPGYRSRGQAVAAVLWTSPAMACRTTCCGPATTRSAGGLHSAGSQVCASYAPWRSRPPERTRRLERAGRDPIHLEARHWTNCPTCLRDCSPYAAWQTSDGSARWQRSSWRSSMPQRVWPGLPRANSTMCKTSWSSWRTIGRSSRPWPTSTGSPMRALP